ncbi:MAG TPA: hypothetical protein PLK49_01130 [Candidatus Dojkabacteria bacterium]|jgi:hypothetical protein|nr:hypothetical protein [Candidatus Dojkabacteria bacterium]HPM13990.1 hypothetical protein [Candidatus Dojkabacteria bacterium]HQA87562.1 hypothetical protein [Candidatus Dojkabacteria bacterium]
MQRGSITLTKEELNNLLSVLNTKSLQGTQLEVKLSSAKDNNEDTINILLSEDEIERILDQVGPPIYENQIINSAIQKIQSLLLTLRKQL